ncbi:hypothetical protein GJ496_001536 [Pomphorhynchus laevis]|nr:hypothetical protein GJ496_001536 [Pomphorhynchus laevis]
MISKPKYLQKYLCIRKFDAQSESELSLKVGQVVEVLNKDRSGWWLVYSYDRKGYVPGSYLLIMDNDEYNIRNDNNYASSFKHVNELFITMKAYTAQRIDELSLPSGTHVEVISKNEDGWWTVRTVSKRSNQGKFPAMFLRSLINECNNKTQNNDNNLIRSHSRRSTLFNFAKRTSKRYSRSSDTLRLNSLSGNTDIESHGLTYWYAIDNYDDIYGDSISLKKGDQVLVLHKTSTGWWRVKIKNREGWAPSSYLSANLPAKELLTMVESSDYYFDEREKNTKLRSSLRADNSSLNKSTKLGYIESQRVPYKSPSILAKSRYLHQNRMIGENLVNTALNDFTSSVMHELKSKLTLQNKEDNCQSKQNKGCVTSNSVSADNKIYVLVKQKTVL